MAGAGGRDNGPRLGPRPQSQLGFHAVSPPTSVAQRVRGVGTARPTAPPIGPGPRRSQQASTHASVPTASPAPSSPQAPPPRRPPLPVLAPPRQASVLSGSFSLGPSESHPLVTSLAPRSPACSYPLICRTRLTLTERPSPSRPLTCTGAPCPERLPPPQRVSLRTPWPLSSPPSDSNSCSIIFWHQRRL